MLIPTFQLKATFIPISAASEGKIMGPALVIHGFDDRPKAFAKVKKSGAMQNTSSGLMESGNPKTPARTSRSFSVSRLVDRWVLPLLVTDVSYTFSHLLPHGATARSRPPHTPLSRASKTLRWVNSL